MSFQIETATPRPPGHGVDTVARSACAIDIEGMGDATDHRMLGNGDCTRPPELDCAFESISETCTFFQTSIESRPTLQAQHDDALAKTQTHRAQLFGSLLNRVDRDAS